MSAEPKERFIDTAPFDPGTAERASGLGGSLAGASTWQLMWWRFSRNRLAVAAAGILALAYLTVPFAEVIAPYDVSTRNPQAIYAPPQAVHFFHKGRFLGPFVYARQVSVDMDTLTRVYTPDRSQPQRLRFFCLGDSYRFWGGPEGRFHLVCPPADGSFYFLGTDRLGRDLFSRIVHGARISLTIGLVGIAVSFTLGLFFGGLAGYFGGRLDGAITRVIEVLRSIPELPLWLALSAAVPVTWPPLAVYFAITLILGLLDWPGLARAVRGKLMALREEPFVEAAELMGARPARVIGVHLLPNFASHLIASATLSIPTMILGETALSFLGLGLRPPITSWGVLLNEAQSVAAIELYPWIILPVLPVIVVILAFNFLGDGLRDAADPYR